MLTADYVKTLLNYDPVTGVFFWTDKAYGKAKNKKAGYADAKKYFRVQINGKKYFLHRIAWLIIYGSWPVGEIDHIDGNKQNNKIKNLRDVSKNMNQHNRKKAASSNMIGILGVSKTKKGRPYRARIKICGIEKNIGKFDTAEDAHKAYLKAKRKFHEGYVE